MTKFKSRTAFGSGEAAPNQFGPPATKFSGRGGLPDGKMTKRYPGAVADVEGSNRRHAKAKHGEGGGMGTVFKGRTGFSK